MLKLYVVNKKLHAQFSCTHSCNNDSHLKPRLYIFEVKKQKLRELTINYAAIPPNATSFTTEVKIPELENSEIDTSNKSPDGYIFNISNNNRSLITGVFDNFHFHQSYFISKNGYNETIIPEYSNNYNYFDLKFIGWIIPKKGTQHAH